MDRSIVAPWKVEEKELGEKLYNKLQGLALLYPPTDSFRKCISVDTFFKPNQQAFFQVMHFLFRLYDPVEFKKRFFWPITDKSAEANFRASTIEYLKFLNEKHNLQWRNIKSYLAVMPGGIKFMAFLLELVGFVLQEIIRQRQRHVCSDIEPEKITFLSIDRIRRRNEFLKEYSSAFINEVDSHIEKLRAKNDVIKGQMELIAQTTTLNITQIMDRTFQKEFEKSNLKLFQQKFTESTRKIISLEEPLTDLKVAMEKFQTRAAETKFDEEAVRQSLIKIHRLFTLKESHLYDETLARHSGADDLNISNLIHIFNCVHCSIEQYLSSVDQKSCSSEFVVAELVSLKEDIQKIGSQLTCLQKKLNSKKKRQATERRIGDCTPICGETAPSRSTESAILMKFVSTPPIRIEMLGSNRNVRLPLLGDANEGAEETADNFLVVPRSVRKVRHAESYFDPDNTHKSKIINPMQLLRTVNRNASKTMPPQQRDLLATGSKWKERQCVFGNDIRTAIPLTLESRASDENSDATSVCQTTVLDLKDLTLKDSPVRHDNKGDPKFSTKKMFAVKKVQDASLNFQKLSTSPSGRLDPLVNFDLKDVSKQQHSNLNKSAIVERKTTCSDTSIQLTLNDLWDSKENNPNSFNSQANPSHLNAIADEDEIFNTSDGVLKDVTL